MRRLVQLIIVGTGVLIPLLAHAVAPQAVTGVSAEYADGQVHVHWNTVGTDASFYRVYYARRSILQSGGLYDDFETVGGSLTNYILKNPPAGDALYIAVLAVNAGLEESDYFTEEVKVDLASGDAVGTTDPSIPATQSPYRRERDTNTLGLLSVDQISSTEISLKFNHNVFLDQGRAENAFRIEDSTGKPLILHRLVLQGATVRITTDPQKRDETYSVSVSAVVRGESENGPAVLLDDTRSTATFIASLGSTDIPAPANASTSSATNASEGNGAFPADSLLRSLSLSAEPDTDGTWRVTVDWESAIPAEQFSGYVVRADREKRELTLPSGEHEMIFTGVARGTFAVSILLVRDGTTTVPVTKSISIGQGSATSRPSTGRVTVPKTMTSTGVGLAVIVAGSGGIAGYLRKRRSAAPQNVTIA